MPALRRRRHLSAQEAAREARHALLRRVASERDADRIALGHTRDDRIETILLNILRGTGLEGLGGMPPIRLPIVRPLYEVSRAQTEAYCAACGLQPRTDSSNAKVDYLRNRLRTELLPYLVTYYNLRAEEALLRLAVLATADNAYLEEQAADVLQRLSRAPEEGVLLLEREALNALPDALKRRALRQGIGKIRGSLTDVAFEMLESLLEAINSGRKQEFILPSSGLDSVHIHCAGDEVAIRRSAPPAQPIPWRQLLATPGVTALNSAGVEVEAILCANVAALQAQTEEAWEGEMVFLRREIRLPILARSWQPGDRIRLRGLGGAKKLQDLFTDSKIRGVERMRYPVLVDAGGEGRILAVAGLRADETALPLAEWEAFATSAPEDGFLLLRLR